MKPYLLVAGDFVSTGGMDAANLALARYLAASGREVHLVAHRVADELLQFPDLHWHAVPRPWHWHLLGAPLLDFAGRWWTARLRRREVRVVVNGGNCPVGEVNWVHYVHAAYSPRPSGNIWRRVKGRLTHRLHRGGERRALRRARLVIADSEKTRDDLIKSYRLPAERVHAVYYGVDGARFRPPSPEERRQTEAAQGWLPERVRVAFVGGLGDRRKGFDTVLNAWRRLCADPRWDGDLVVIGAGPELETWRGRVRASGLENRVEFLGFRRDVASLLGACDALVSPTRYEPYGLGVHEALCTGLPALVSRSAGVAERYPLELSELLLDDPEDAEELAVKLLRWRSSREDFSMRVRAWASVLRRGKWDDMAAQMAALIEGQA